jgi:hypothetical protein
LEGKFLSKNCGLHTRKHGFKQVPDLVISDSLALSGITIYMKEALAGKQCHQLFPVLHVSIHIFSSALIYLISPPNLQERFLRLLHYLHSYLYHSTHLSPRSRTGFLPTDVLIN